MNIYEKMQLAKKEFLEANVKKSGKNKFAGYTYYELADILPVLINICDKLKIFTAVSYGNNEAKLEIINVENPEEKIYYSSPMRELELKGCNQIQALGGVETYQRRYLYMSAFDIVENDMFDSLSAEQNEEKPKMITDEQFNFIMDNATDEQLAKILKKFKVSKIEELDIKQASVTIQSLRNANETK